MICWVPKDWRGSPMKILSSFWACLNHPPDCWNMLMMLLLQKTSQKVMFQQMQVPDFFTICRMNYREFKILWLNWMLERKCFNDFCASWRGPSLLLLTRVPGLMMETWHLRLKGECCSLVSFCFLIKKGEYEYECSIWLYFPFTLLMAVLRGRVFFFFYFAWMFEQICL